VESALLGAPVEPSGGEGKKACGEPPSFGQGPDSADGRLYLGRRWWNPHPHCLKLDWNPSRSAEVIDGIARMHRILALASDGEPLPQTSGRYCGSSSWHIRWVVAPWEPHRRSVSSTMREGSAVPGLYVMDGSVIPRAIGRNSSKTIAAIAERSVELVLSEVREL
jgi:cholesterol oxidase